MATVQIPVRRSPPRPFRNPNNIISPHNRIATPTRTDKYQLPDMPVFQTTRKRPATAPTATTTITSKPANGNKSNQPNDSNKLSEQLKAALPNWNENDFEFGYPVTFGELLTTSAKFKRVNSFTNVTKATRAPMPGQKLRHKNQRISQQTREDWKKFVAAEMHLDKKQPEAA